MADTICWRCANACGGCSWSRHKNQQPVEGWKAERGRWMQYAECYSYTVVECPEFQPDGRKECREYENYTPEEDETLLSMRRRGETYDMIAARLNRTKASLLARMKVLKREGKA